jgi:hypothetical protein
MKKRALLLVFVVTLVASSRAQTSAETAIRHLLDRQTTDWNRGDVDAFMRGYEDSPNTTFVGQTVQYGYATIRDRYKKLYTTPAAMGKLTFSHLAIRQLRHGYRQFSPGADHRGRRQCRRNFLPPIKEGRAGLEDYFGSQQPHQLTARQICSTSLSLLRHISSIRLISSSVSF